MAKLNPEDLDKISEKKRGTMMLREGAGMAKITVHMGTCGIAAGARNILSTFLTQIEDSKVQDVILTTSGCAGLCSQEPMVTLELKGEAPVKYIDLTEEKVKEIFSKHIIKHNIVTEYALAIGSERVS